MLSQAGMGISHAIGTGGRDLHSDVGGISTLQALHALMANAETEQIVVISKPPASDVVGKLLEAAGTAAKPVTFCFVGSEQTEHDLPHQCRIVNTLKAAAEAVLDRQLPAVAADLDKAVAAVSVQRQPLISGMFCGGTLCAEAQVVLHNQHEPVRSNAAIPGVMSMQENSEAHTIIDFGDDQFTQGAPHPMIDPSVRNNALRDELLYGNAGVCCSIMSLASDHIRTRPAILSVS